MYFNLTNLVGPFKEPTLASAPIYVIRSIANTNAFKKKLKSLLLNRYSVVSLIYFKILKPCRVLPTIQSVHSHYKENFRRAYQKTEERLLLCTTFLSLSLFFLKLSTCDLKSSLACIVTEQYLI